MDDKMNNTTIVEFDSIDELTCHTCGKRLDWEFDSDPDVPGYYSPCDCNDRVWISYPKSMYVSFEDDEDDKDMCEICDDANKIDGSNVVCIGCNRKI